MENIDGMDVMYRMDVMNGMDFMYGMEAWLLFMACMHGYYG